MEVRPAAHLAGFDLMDGPKANVVSEEAGRQTELISKTAERCIGARWILNVSVGGMTVNIERYKSINYNFLLIFMCR